MENKIQEFLNNIDKWTNDQWVLPVSFNKEEVYPLLSLSLEDLKKMSVDELLNGCILLNAYLHHLQQLHNRENCVFNFATESIWYIISPVINKMPNDYTKGQKKNYYLAIQQNELAEKLLLLKNTSESRIKVLEGQINILDKKIDMLYNLAKRKQYEHSSS